jgi:hypothetical protein
MDNNNFYCYSKRMYHFLSFLGIRYNSIGENSNTKQRYWVYDKSQKLDLAIEQYNSLKHNFN